MSEWSEWRCNTRSGKRTPSPSSSPPLHTHSLAATGPALIAGPLGTVRPWCWPRTLEGVWAQSHSPPAKLPHSRSFACESILFFRCLRIERQRVSLQASSGHAEACASARGQRSGVKCGSFLRRVGDHGTRIRAFLGLPIFCVGCVCVGGGKCPLVVRLQPAPPRRGVPAPDHLRGMPSGPTDRTSKDRDQLALPLARARAGRVSGKRL